MSETYKIIRKFQRDNLEDIVVATGLTREEAERHCTDLETSSYTAKDPAKAEYTKAMGNWYDSFYMETTDGA